MNRSLFYTWAFFKFSYKIKSFIINFGPQHPAAHGVLRLVLQLEGEIIQRLDTHIGLLHRGTECLVESKSYEKGLPYFDRLDYVSMMTQEHTYCLAIENLLQIRNLSTATNYTRVLFDELTRILNHFLAVACHALDIGSMSSIFWGFEEREKLMEFYERVSGARMHAAFHKPAHNFSFFFNYDLLVDILQFTQNCYTTLNEIHNVLTYNKIWKQRLINIGVLSVEDCVRYGLTGVLLRSSGFKRDVRLSHSASYSSYSTLKFRSFIGINGDTYDRYLIRMLEMGESLSIVTSTITTLLKFFPTQSVVAPASLLSTFTEINYPKTLSSYTSMEDLIAHFINNHSGYSIKSNSTNVYIESPKGEFGVNLMSDNTETPLRCKIRSPSYYNLQALSKLSKGHYLADLAAVIGTIDIVFGEIDR